MARKNTIVAAAVIGLAAIVAAGPTGMLVSLAEGQTLQNAGHVELNPAGPDANGMIGARATDAGIAANLAAQTTGGTVTGTVETAKVAFAIDDGYEMPASAKRGGGRGNSVYPFDALAIGQSFFVPNTAERPNAAKSMASTVGSANARYLVNDPAGRTVTVKGENGQPDTTAPMQIAERKFRVLPVDETDKGRGPGARVWRVALA